MFLRQLRYHRQQGIADRRSEAKSKTKNTIANGAPRHKGKIENNIGIPNQEHSISGEPYRLRHKARASIDTAAELRIQARKQREPTMPPLKSGNPDNRPRSRHDLCTTTAANGVPPTSEPFLQEPKQGGDRPIKTKAVYSSRTDGGTIFLTKKSKRSN